LSVAVRDLLPGSQDVRARLPSRFTIACLGLGVMILIAATVDLLHTESRLPDVSTPPCERESPSCRNAQLSEQLARLRAADPLQDQYDSRAWLYAPALLAIAAIATANALRTRPRTAWLQVFTNLGVIGVWLAIAAVLLLIATDGSSLAPPPGPTLLLPVALIVAAVAGTLIGGSEGWAEQGQVDGVRQRVAQVGRLAIHVGTAGQAKRSRMEELGRWLTLAALALTGLSCLLALVSLLGEADCAARSGTPGWADPLDALAAVTAIGGMAAGIGALILRRWIAALIGLVVCPLALLVVLYTTCAFY
jgi:hypothetical protein